ncbi:MAG TPA: transposase, partial [Methylococcaceae bacterium]|nr:transposase [Methylococcaceae bacterium]
PWSTAESLRKISARLFISYQDSRALYHHLIWAKSIKVDLVGTPIQMTAPLPTFEIIENTAKILLAAEGLS